MIYRAKIGRAVMATCMTLASLAPSMLGCNERSTTPPAHSSAPPAPKPSTASDAPRTITSRAALPDDVRDALPAHGVYVALLGEAGSDFIILDRDAGTIRKRTVRPGAKPEQTTRQLDAAVRDKLWQLAQSARRAPRPAAHEPHLDYDEVLAIGDGDAVFHFDAGGSIEQPAAAALVRAMIDAAK